LLRCVRCGLSICILWLNTIFSLLLLLYTYNIELFKCSLLLLLFQQKRGVNLNGTILCYCLVSKFRPLFLNIMKLVYCKSFISYNKLIVYISEKEKWQLDLLKAGQLCSRHIYSKLLTQLVHPYLSKFVQNKKAQIKKNVVYYKIVWKMSLCYTIWTILHNFNDDNNNFNILVFQYDQRQSASKYPTIVLLIQWWLWSYCKLMHKDAS